MIGRVGCKGVDSAVRTRRVGGLTEAIDGIAWFGVGGFLRVWVSSSLNLCWVFALTYFPHVVSQCTFFSPLEIRLYIVDISSSLTEGGMGDR